MTIEEKAKAYDEALERARKINSGEGVEAPPNWTVCEVIFPELKESEDDKIVDAIRKALESKIEDLGNGVTKTACLAWLEKQGKQKSAWSKEDENMLGDIEEAIVNYWYGGTQDILLEWLASIKEDRMNL